MANLIEDDVLLIVNNAMKKTAERIRDEMQYQIRRKANKGYATGALADSVVIDHPAPYSYLIYPTAKSEKGFPYAGVLDQGRRAMWRNKKAFKFVAKDGETVVTKRIKRFDGVHYIRSTYNKFT